MQTPAPYAIVESLYYIDRHLDETLTLSVISAYVGYSESHFARIFKRHMGCPAMDYVKKRRLTKAYNEIMGGAKIINAALNCGYDSHGGFAKAFRTEFGCSPAYIKTMVTHMEYLGGNFMNGNFLKQVDERLTKSELYTLLQGELRDSGIKMDFDRLDSVYEYACKA